MMIRKEDDTGESWKRKTRTKKNRITTLNGAQLVKLD